MNYLKIESFYIYKEKESLKAYLKCHVCKIIIISFLFKTDRFKRIGASIKGAVYN